MFRLLLASLFVVLALLAPTGFALAGTILPQ